MGGGVEVRVGDPTGEAKQTPRWGVKVRVGGPTSEEKQTTIVGGADQSGRSYR